MTEKLLLEIIVVLLGVLVLMAARIWFSHEKQHEFMQEELTHLRKQREHCADSFASKDSVARAHERIDEHDDDIVELKTSVAKIQGCGGKP